jgi:hypothetical protein
MWAQKAFPWGYGQLYAGSIPEWEDAPDFRNTELARNWDSWKDSQLGPSRDLEIGLLNKAMVVPFNS